MSAARSRNLGPPGATPSPGPHLTSPSPAGTGRRRLLGAALALTAAWSLALLLMDIGASRSRIVSPDQISKAHVVVVARRVDSASDRIRVERTLRGDLPPDHEVRVLNLADVTDLSDDRSYLFPLSRFRNDFKVTELEGQRASPLVYPASPDVIEQAKAILR